MEKVQLQNSVNFGDEFFRFSVELLNAGQVESVFIAELEVIPPGKYIEGGIRHQAQGAKQRPARVQSQGEGRTSETGLHPRVNFAPQLHIGFTRRKGKAPIEREESFFHSFEGDGVLFGRVQFEPLGRVMVETQDSRKADISNPTVATRGILPLNTIGNRKTAREIVGDSVRNPGAGKSKRILVPRFGKLEFPPLHLFGSGVKNHAALRQGQGGSGFYRGAGAERQAHSPMMSQGLQGAKPGNHDDQSCHSLHFLSSPPLEINQADLP